MKMTEELARRILVRAQMRRPLSQEQKDAIIADWLAGMKYKDIQDKHHVGKTHVSAAVREATKQASDFVLMQKGKKP